MLGQCRGEDVYSRRSVHTVREEGGIGEGGGRGGRRGGGGGGRGGRR